MNQTCFAQISIPTNEDEQKKLAEKLFAQEDYANAFKLYSTLLAHYPKEPLYNYKIGVCILNVGDENGDRKSCIHYLEVAKQKANELDKEVYFYMGRAYHVNYDFDDAIIYYQEYKSVASQSSIKKMNVDHEIQMARNGKYGISKFPNVKVIEKKRLPSADYFRSYQQNLYGGNLIVKPEEFIMSADKKKKEKSILFQTKDKATVLFGSYGETGEKGKDIYIAKRQGNGEFGKPVPISKNINTEYDDDYPFLHPSGKKLFFCSKGHNSMGGYDIFKSEWDESKQDWGKPENLQFPINTPLDDIQFVTDSLEKIAVFSSTRISENGKIDVYKIDIEKRPASMCLINGSTEKNEKITGQTTITVKDLQTGESFGPFISDKNGNYNFEIPANKNYVFTVESPGFPIQSQSINVPESYDHSPLNQILSYEDEKLIIKSYTGDQNNEYAYKAMKKIFLEKMKMEVSPNVEENLIKIKTEEKRDSVNILKQSDENKNNISENKSNNKNSKDKKNISNNDLIEIAKNDLQEIKTETEELQKQYENSEKMLYELKEAISRKEATIDSIQNNNNISQTDNKEELIVKEKIALTELKEIYTNANQIVAGIKTDYNNKLEEKKIQEKIVNVMNEIKKNPKNKEKEKLLLETEMELIKHQEATNNLKHDDILFTTNNELEEEKKINNQYLEEKNKIVSEIKNTEIEILEKNKEIKNEDDKNIFESIKAEIENLELDKKESENKLVEINSKISKQEKEINRLINQKDFIENMLGKTNIDDNNLKNEKIDTNNTNLTLKTEDNQQSQEDDNFNKTLNQLKSNITDLNNKGITLPEILENEKNLTQIKKTIESQLSILKEKNNTSSIKQKIKELEIEIAKNEQEIKKTIEIKNKKIQDNLIAQNNSDKNKNSNIDSTTSNLSTEETNAKISSEKILKQRINEIETEINSIKEITYDSTDLISSIKIIDNTIIKIEKIEKEVKDSIYNTISSLKNELQILANKIETIKKMTDSISTSYRNKIKEKEETVLIDKSESENKIIKQYIEINNENKRLSNHFQANEISNTEAKNQLNESENKFNQIYLEETLMNDALLNEIIKYDSTIKEKIKDSLKKSSEVLKSTANKIRKDVKNAELSKRKSMIIEAEKIESESENNLLRISEIEIELNNKRINKNEELIKDLLILYNLEKIEELKKENKPLIDKIKELKKSMNTYYLEASNKKNYDNKSELLTMTDEAGKALIDNQKKLIIQFINSLPENYNKNTSISSNTDDIISAIKINEQEKVNILLELSEANIKEHAKQKKNIKTVKKSSPNAKNPEPKEWIEKSDELIIMSKKLQKNMNLYENKNKILDSILKMESDAISLVNKAIIFYDNNNLSEQGNNELNANDKKKLIINSFLENSDSIDISLVNRKEKSIDENSNELIKQKDENSNNINSNNKNIKKDTIDKEDKNSEISKKDSTINEMIAVRINKDSLEKIKNNSNAINNYKNPNDSLKIVDNNKSNNENLNDDINNRNKQNQNFINNKNNKTDNLESDSLASINNSLTNNLKLSSDSIRDSKNDNRNNQLLIKSNNDTTQKSNTNNEIVNKLSENNSVNEGNKRDSISKVNVSENKIQPIKTNGIIVTESDAYSDSKPIPVDNKFPDGIVFTIQVGAFKTIVPNKTFKGLNPVNGTKTANGFIRYQAGLFNNYNEANAAKNDLKKMGFKDAFIAVYKNNVRVSLNEVLGELNEKIENNENTSVGINNSRNIPDGTQILNIDNNTGNANLVTTLVEKISGLFYTIQIGLYSGTPSEKQLFYLKPIQNEAFNSGNYRYMAGIYNKLERVRTDATKVKALGISDAFICAYSKGKRVKISEIQGKENDPNFIFESEKPIEFQAEKNTETLSAKTDTIKKVIKDANINNDSKIIFSNGVNKEPDPTPENGVKLSTEGITYKIQIGAYSKAVPNSVSENWSKIKNWPVRNFTNNSNLIIYNVGSFGDFQNAKKLLFEIKDLGVEDAFITVFKDGVRLYGEQATQYTR